MQVITGDGTKPGLLINRNYALLWLGQTVSAFGDFVFNTTLVVWIAQELARGQSWSPIAVSAVMIAASVPILLLGPIAGVFVDRWDKRRTMMRMDGASAALVALLLLVSGALPLPGLSGGVPVGWTLGAIYAVVLLVNSCAVFFRPASLVTLGDIVPEEHRPRAAGMTQASFSLAMLVGPPIAAPMVLVFGSEWALMIDAASFVVSLIAVWAIRVPVHVSPKAETPLFLRELREGLRFFRRSRLLTTLAISGVIVMLGAGSLNALDIFFVTRNLHAPAELYGVLGAAQGAGMILGAVVASVIAQRVGLTRMIWGVLLVVGVLIGVYARMDSFVPGVVVIFVLGLTLPGLNIAIDPLILLATPREFVGRVSATLEPLVTAASIVGTALGGFLYGTVLRDFHAMAFGISFGPLDTIFLWVAALCVLGGVYAMLNLRLERPAPPSEPEEAGAAATAA